MSAPEESDVLWIELGRDRKVRADHLPPPLLACVTFIDFMNHVGQALIIDTVYQQLVTSTVSRSFQTYTGICGLLYDESPTQVAMLCRALFEDVIVVHWLMFNDSDPDWLVSRFQRHREAMALYQQKLVERTEWTIGPPLLDNLDDVRARQNALLREFGGEAQKNWWDPGTEGEGRGKPVGLRGVAAILENAAAGQERFHPRFAGGDEPVLRRMELVVNKWFTQCMHHTALGLPINITLEDGRTPDVVGNQSYLVAFSGYWMFAQQLYALHELYGRDAPEFDRPFYTGLRDGFGAPESTLHLD